MNSLAENTILLKALPKNKNRTVIFRICQVLAEKNGTCFQNQKQFKQFKEIMEFFLFFILNAVKTTKKTLQNYVLIFIYPLLWVYVTLLMPYSRDNTKVLRVDFKIVGTAWNCVLWFLNWMERRFIRFKCLFKFSARLSWRFSFPFVLCKL